ncbi:hypothetical protein NESM_000416000 [Novymonas esmeraldas]|uniref:Centrosomal protein of 70 kDa n=1 Tax=Novymonas esmeraldas TaxID=1808958 RepID=A0AAW0ELD6_9TRYP
MSSTAEKSSSSGSRGGGGSGQSSDAARIRVVYATPAARYLERERAADSITSAGSSTRSSHSSAEAAARGPAMPLYMIHAQQQSHPSHHPLTAGMHVALMGTAPPPPPLPTAAVRQTSSSSSPPTPSPLSTSGSDGRDGDGAAAAAAAAATAVMAAPRRSKQSAGARRSAAPTAMSSASIHAAAAATATTATSAVGPPPTGASGSAATPPSAAVFTTAAVAATPPLPASVSAPATAAVAEEAAAAAREAQRQQILDLANALLTFCSLSHIPVTSIRQCTSSFFVLLYQRLFDCTIAGIDRSPNTAEKRRHNVTLVLEQLRRHPYALTGIEAEEVVKLNEDHISRLVMVFVQVAEDMRLQQELQQQQQQQQQDMQLQQHATHTPPLAAATVTQHGSGAVGHGAQHAGPHAEDYSPAKTVGSGVYAPVGYTVAEVMPSPPQYHHHHHHQHQQQHQQQQAGLAGVSGGGHHTLLQPREDFFVAPAPPLNGGGVAVGAPVVGGGDGGGSGSLGSASRYLDSTVMPADGLLEEWYRNLVYPPPGGHAEETEVTSAMDPGHVSLQGGYSQRPHPRSDRFTRDAGVSLTSSGSPLYATAERRSPAGRRLSSPQQQQQHHRHHRTQLNADDIVRRCQRLEHALDTQERRHRQLFIQSPDSSAPSPGVHAGGAAEGHRLDSPHAHRYPPHQQQQQQQQQQPVATADEHEGLAHAPSASLPSRPQHATASSQRVRRRPLRPAAPPTIREPPLTRQERELLAHRPQHRIDTALRDVKIERLRSARYLGDMQQLLRQRMRREYDAQLSAMRGSLKASMQSAREGKVDLMRRVRDENDRYRAAYATLMTAAANEAQVPARVMSRHTAQLADYYATSLQHSHAMCEALKQEADRRTKSELLRYAEEVSAWQQHFLL